MNHPVKTLVSRFGLPRIIIVGFFLFLLACAGGFGMDLPQFLSDCLRRWGMYGVLTLAMIPAIQCGIGPNFGISMGIVGGLLGGLIVIEMGIAQIPALTAIHPMFAMWVAVMVAIFNRHGFGCGHWIPLRPSVKPCKRLRDDGYHLCRFLYHRFYEYDVDAAAL